MLINIWYDDYKFQIGLWGWTILFTVKITFTKEWFLNLIHQQIYLKYTHLIKTNAYSTGKYVFPVVFLQEKNNNLLIKNCFCIHTFTHLK